MKSGPTNLLIAIALFVATPSMASEIVGTATVVDGDTIEIQGQRIRLHGIDAPERGQLCKRNGSLYRCGQAAALALADMVGQAVIRCQPNGVDRYKRIIGVCFKGDQDLNRWMVRNGWAVAYRRYSQDYVPDELTATATRIGVWSGTFEMPWEWRKKHR
jgi:endonuclease YncB( thermonuclease family)